MKGYKLKIGEAQYEQISEIFSINEQTILNKRNELEQKYIMEEFQLFKEQYYKSC